MKPGPIVIAHGTGWPLSLGQINTRMQGRGWASRIGQGKARQGEREGERMASEKEER